MFKVRLDVISTASTPANVKKIMMKQYLIVRFTLRYVSTPVRKFAPT